MKTLTKNILSLFLFLTAIVLIGSSCSDDDGPKEEEKACNFAISYKVDGVLTTHIENVVTAEIWPENNYTVNKKVYDIFTEEAPTFNYHTSMSFQDETSTHVSNWQEVLGSTLIPNTVNLESNGLTFKIENEAFVVGDLVKISFSGTTVGGKVITEGLICTHIDILH
jgi:hypothetical protein